MRLKEYLKLACARHTYQQNWNAIKYVLSRQMGMYKNANLIYEPINVTAAITYRCDLRCDFCGVFGPDRKAEEKYQDMSFSFYQEILHRFRSALIVSIGGGEPFLHKDIFKMIEYGRICKKSVFLATNGISISNKVDEVISSAPSSLNISLNANNEIGYRKINNAPSGTFDEVLQTIMKLVDKRNKENKKIRLGISYVCTKENYKGMPDMVKLADDLEVDGIYFINLMPIHRAGVTEEHCLYDDDEDIIEVISSLEKSQFNIEVTGPKLCNKRFVKRRLQCLQPFNRITVNPIGDVYTCCTSIVRAGNLFSNSNVWNNDIFQSFRKRMTSGDPLIIPDLCKICPNSFG